VSQVPRPGIFLALIEDSNSSTLPAALLMKAQSSNYPDVQNFLRDPASSYDPDPLTTNDVFIGYGGEDEEWAKELYKQLEGAGLKCFLAKLNIPTGAVWTDRLREELLSSRLGLLLLTRNSFDRPWLMCEAGALWATGTPIVPAYRYIQLTEVPDIISKHQARKIETQSEQEALISELEQQLRG
jgi:TIR domain